MKAAITPNYGPAQILEVQEVPRPTVGPKDVLVQVHATPVTAGDRRLRSADFPGVSALPGRLMMGLFRPRSPIQGTMFAGRVVEVGDDVTRYAVGDDVFGSADDGAYAEYLMVGEDAPMAKIPDGVSYEAAADVPYGGVTALHFLRDVGDVRPGERVLILGASGGVGRYAVQIAKHQGAEVTAVASRRNESMVRALGADHFVDYRAGDWRDQDGRFDVVFDIADVSSFAESRRMLTEQGRYMTLSVSVRILWDMLRTSFGDGRRAKFAVALGTRDQVVQLRDWLAEGVIRPTIGDRFALGQIAHAHAAADAGSTSGTTMVVLRPSLALRAA